MTKQKRDFDQDAATWDDAPRRLKMAEDIVRTMLGTIEFNPDLRVLDFGCGTGLLTLQLQPHVAHITAVDNSRGMLDVLKTKLAGQRITNVDARYVDLDNGDSFDGRYDLIVTSMTLHHIPDIMWLLKTFHAHTTPGAQLCIADLDLEEGCFHTDNTGVFHYGFDREALRKSLQDAGFTDINITTAAQVLKPGEGGTQQTFTIFLMTGRAA